MADRISVDIEGMRDEILEAYADNPLWSELSLSQKIRRLLRERLDLLKQECDRADASAQDPKSE
ncbi:MAG: hypothetical protein AAF821_27495 [Cyanobacteria bacterium P01_D01_bin.156]